MNESALRVGYWGLGFLLCVGCVQMSSTGQPDSRVPSGYKAPDATDVSECVAVLGTRSSRMSLDSSGIRLVSWNTRKGRGLDWRQSTQPWMGGVDLVLLQEAAFRNASDLPVDGYFSFAPGFATRTHTTGVMTVSAVAPLASCHLTVREPWLGTPKAIAVTEYGLSETADTLLVVNVHAINFAFGLAAFEQQVRSVFEVMRNHQGPVILSGDFNTWRRARAQLLDDWTVCHGLTATEYSVDHRVKVFGQHLDQVYVRGLTVATSTTRVTPSSDHNPMIVTLTL